MSLTRALPLSVLLLAGLCRAHRAPPAPPATSQESGQVPASHLRVLSLGLGHLLQGVQENVALLEREGEVMSVQFNQQAKALERLQKQSSQTGRAHKQVRKDLQIVAARRDRLWKAVRDLQEELEELGAEQRSMQQRMIRILRSGKRLAESGPGRRAKTETSNIQVLLDKQTRRLASLTSEVEARDRLINRRLQNIKRLEKQLASSA